MNPKFKIDTKVVFTNSVCSTQVERGVVVDYDNNIKLYPYVIQYVDGNGDLSKLAASECELTHDRKDRINKIFQ